MSDVNTVVARLQAELQVGTREAVNAVALEKTLQARRNVQRVLGADQRMSGVIYRQNANGRRSRVSAAVRAKGGTRINPYFREARSVTNPVALVGVRGPAQYIEHSRRGGYTVRPVGGRVGVSAPARANRERRRAELFGAGTRPTAPALKIGDLDRAVAHPGPITRTSGPITRAFLVNDPISLERARAALAGRVERIR